MAFKPHEKEALVAYYLKHCEDDLFSLRIMAPRVAGIGLVNHITEKTLSYILRDAGVYVGNHRRRYSDEDNQRYIKYWKEHHEDPGFSIHKMSKVVDASYGYLGRLFRSEGLIEDKCQSGIPAKPKQKMDMFWERIISGKRMGSTINQPSND